MLTDELIALDHLCWLIESGREMLTAMGPPISRQPRLPSELLGKLEPWQHSLLQQQYELRWRSRSRFPRPELWLWTERSLAQASDYWSAQYKARLFPKDERVIDACCGAGADLVALAERGEVLGVDGQPGLSQLARDNARAHGYQVPVATEMLTSAWHPAADWLSIDPDRRPTGRRTNDADEFSPSLTDVLTLASRVRGAVVKLAPSTRIQVELCEHIDECAQRVWLGNQGECRQQLLLIGELQREQPRTAVLCEPLTTATEDQNPVASHATPVHGESALSEFSGSSERPMRVVDVPLRFVLDLHNVLHAAELQATWANQQRMCALGGTHGYYTADELPGSAWAQAFEVLDVLPWDDRQLRKWLRKHRAGTVEVKSRALGVQAINIDANVSQRRYSAAEGEPVTLLVTRLGDRIRGIAARRIG